MSVQLTDAGSFTDHVIVASFIVKAPFRVKVSMGGVISSVKEVHGNKRGGKEAIKY